MANKRLQVNANLSNDTFDLLESASREFGMKPSQLAAEALASALPLYIEIKRQQIANEREQLRLALEIAMGKPSAESPKTIIKNPHARRKA